MQRLLLYVASMADQGIDAQGIAVAGANAYVANAYGQSISRIDLTDPSQPRLGESYMVPGYAYDIMVGREMAFVSAEFKGMQMVNVRTPQHPFAAGGYKTGGKVRRVVMNDDLLYVLNVDGGLTILRYNGFLHTFLPLQTFPQRTRVLDAPILHPVANPSGHGDYVVAWTIVSHATEYILEQATNTYFSDSEQVYRGPGNSAHITGMGAARYHYRVLAKSPVGESAWSDSRTVDVLWEKEPNDDGRKQANGPIVLELAYHGAFAEAGDSKDYYYFYLDYPRSLSVGLVVPPQQDYDIALRTASLKLIEYSSKIGEGTDEVINTSTLPVGRYLVQVYNPKQTTSALDYVLRVRTRN